MVEMSSLDDGSQELKSLRHDLYNPINQIIGYSELLSEELLEGESIDGEDLLKIRAAASQLLDMIRSRLADQSSLNEQEAADQQGSPRSLPSPLKGVRPEIPKRSHPASTRQYGRILVVDDDANNRDLLVSVLIRDGHIALSASDGEEALRLLRESRYDLVLLDVQMPVMDGPTTLWHINQDQSLSLIPVIMVSGVEDLETVIGCIENGAIDYLPKPCNLTMLRARIGISLERKSWIDQNLKLIDRFQASQRTLDRELAEARSRLEGIQVNDASDDERNSLVKAMERMTLALVQQRRAIGETLQDLELELNKKVVGAQVKSITSDPSFTSLSERAAAMRRRRSLKQGGG